MTKLFVDNADIATLIQQFQYRKNIHRQVEISNLQVFNDKLANKVYFGTLKFFSKNEDVYDTLCKIYPKVLAKIMTEYEQDIIDVHYSYCWSQIDKAIFILDNDHFKFQLTSYLDYRTLTFKLSSFSVHNVNFMEEYTQREQFRNNDSLFISEISQIILNTKFFEDNIMLFDEYVFQKYGIKHYMSCITENYHDDYKLENDEMKSYSVKYDVDDEMMKDADEDDEYFYSIHAYRKIIDCKYFEYVIDIFKILIDNIQTHAY